MANLFMRDTCDDLSFSEESVICFVDYFEQYLHAQNLSYPISLSGNASEQKLLFVELMYEFLHESETMTKSWTNLMHGLHGWLMLKTTVAIMIIVLVFRLMSTQNVMIATVCCVE